jgi:hypothetical protein
MRRYFISMQAFKCQNVSLCWNVGIIFDSLKQLPILQRKKLLVGKKTVSTIIWFHNNCERKMERRTL